MIIDIDSPRCNSTWPLDTEACPDLLDYSPAVTGMAASVAVFNLFALTGRRYGTCEAVFRPCVQPDSRLRSTWRATTHLSNPNWGVYTNVLPFLNGPCAVDCFTPNRATLHLPVHPVREVNGVTIEGTDIPSSEFAVFGQREIVWQSPTDRLFPNFQDLTEPLGNDGTWSIDVTYGHSLPAVTGAVVALYACQLASMIAKGECALPGNISSISRQGITYELVSDEAFDRGLVGLPIVDRFVLALNPNRLNSAPSVHTPESIRRAARFKTSP